MRTRHALTVAIAAAAIVATTATAAQAAVYTTGTKSCPSGELVVVVATYSGAGSIYYPEGVFRTRFTHSDLYQQKFWTDVRSTSWEVLVGGGSLDDGGTYAECEPSED
jgi:hypothetical protein